MQLESNLAWRGTFRLFGVRSPSASPEDPRKCAAKDDAILPADAAASAGQKNAAYGMQPKLLRSPFTSAISSTVIHWKIAICWGFELTVVRDSRRVIFQLGRLCSSISQNPN
jgi:hypothetical protein